MNFFREKKNRWFVENNKEILTTTITTTTTTTTTNTTTNSLADDPIIREAIKILENSCLMLSETERRIRDSVYVNNTNENNVLIL